MSGPQQQHDPADEVITDLSARLAAVTAERDSLVRAFKQQPDEPEFIRSMKRRDEDVVPAAPLPCGGTPPPPCPLPLYHEGECRDPMPFEGDTMNHEDAPSAAGLSAASPCEPEPKPSSDRPRAGGELTMGDVQVQLPWTIPYSPEFSRAGLYLGHLQFQHALIHVAKAVGKLAALIDDADHGRGDFPRDEVGDRLADLVICSMRMANVIPGGEPLDLWNRTLDRIEAKNGIKLRGNRSSRPMGEPTFIKVDDDEPEEASMLCPKCRHVHTGDAEICMRSVGGKSVCGCKYDVVEAGLAAGGKTVLDRVPTLPPIHGSKTEASSPPKCGTCEGNGFIMERTPSEWFNDAQNPEVEKPCPTCRKGAT